MRVETGHGKPGTVDAEQRFEAGRGDAARPNDLDAVKRAYRLGQGEVDGDRHDAQFGAGEHHGDVDPARQLGEILGMPRMSEAGVLEGLLLDGIGHHPGDLAGKRQSGTALDGLQGGRCIGWIRVAGPHGSAQPHRQHGQRRLEDSAGVGRPRDLAHRDIEAELVGEGGQADGVVEDEEGPRAALAHRPGFEAEFAADTGRLAHRHGERRGRRHGCLTSMVAWRRRSRM